jgi:nucleotide-binding universal stress UspA family protein
MIRFPPRRVLVPADLTGPSLSAVRAGRELARRFRGSLSVVYAESLPPSLMGLDADEDPGEVARQFREFRAWREERLRREAAGLPAGRLHVRTVRGRPERLVPELARGRVADLIVMGTHGRKGWDRAAGGSVAEAVVARAKTPVLIVRPFEGALRVRRVLCPTNLTAHADDALVAARAAAKAFGARLTALTVVPPGDDAGMANGRLKARLDSLFGRGWTARADAVVRRGDPRREILAEAAAHDLVVLSAHRRPLLGESVLGSTAERVLRYCAVPVLTIPSDARRRGVAIIAAY